MVYLLQDSHPRRGAVVPSDDSGQETETRSFLNRRGTSAQPQITGA